MRTSRVLRTETDLEGSDMRKGSVGVQLEEPDQGSLLGGVWSIQDGADAERVGAAWSLQADRRQEDVSILIRWLDEGPPGVRAAVATAIGLLGDSSGADPLARLLLDDDLDVRHAAAIALRRLDDPRAEEGLLSVLCSMAECDDAFDRARAARTLRALASPKAVEVLVRLLEDPDVDVRADAAESLRAIGREA